MNVFLLFIAQIPPIKTEVRRIIRVALPISSLSSWYRDTIVKSSSLDQNQVRSNTSWCYVFIGH